MPERSTRSVGLPEFAVRRPVTMLMLFLSLLVVGAVAWFNIPLQLFPEGFNPPFLYVWLAYPNSNPTDNLERMAIPAEEAFWTVKGVKRISSHINEGGSGHLIEFQQNSDMDVAYLGVKDRLERARAELPQDQRYVYIWRFSEADQPILYLGVSITGNYEDPYLLVQEELVQRLERVDGVAKVEFGGDSQKMIRVEFLLDRLKANRIDAGSIIGLLQNADFTLAGGAITDGNHQVMLRMDGRLKNLDELKRLPVGANGLRLEDIAQVSYSETKRTWVERIDGRDAIELAVYKTSEANTVKLSEQLNGLLETLRHNPRLAGIRIETLFDQGTYIKESLRNLEESGIWGGIFAVAILFFFLRKVRMTLFITLAIPLSLLATVICLYFMGWSLNLVTLSGLMISVGMVVDNAIVVVESIHTSRQEGLSPRAAAISGTNEVALAITMATLTTVVVFLPLMLMSGNRMLTFFMLRVGLPVILALLFSLIMALMLIPLLVDRFALEGVSRGNQIVDWCADATRRVVIWALNHRRDAVLMSVLLLASTAIPIRHVISTDQEQGNINDFRMEFDFPAYFTLSDADSAMTRMEHLIDEKRESYDVRTIMTGFRRGNGHLQVFMNPPADRFWLTQGLGRMLRALGIVHSSIMTREEVIEDLKKRFNAPPGVEMTTSWDTGRNEDAVYVSVYGEDTGRLLKIVGEVKSRLSDLPGVISLRTDLERSSDELQIRFDREATSRNNINPQAAAFGITAMTRGVDLPHFNWQGHELDAKAELAEADRASLSQMMNLPVGGMTTSGAVTLDDVAQIDYQRGIGEITRENRRTRIRIKVTGAGDDLNKLSQAIDTRMEGISLPPGYEWGKGERFAELEESAQDRNNAWILAVVFVLLIMGALFESFLHPWTVITTVPFSFFGVWWFLFLTGTQFGLMSVIGVIILIGIVVNNAIVLVDRANRLREQGMDRDQALALATQQRFRPIAMTALTTILGLVPMAVGDSSLIGIPYAPMGRAIIGGMVTATISTPVIVSLAYSYVDDFQIWMKSYWSSLRRW